MTQTPILVQRPSPRNKFEFFERGWRVALAWILIVMIVVPVALTIAIVLFSIAFGFFNAVTTGQPIPDLTGGLDRLLTPMMPYIGPGIAGLIGLLMMRHREVNTQLGNTNPHPFEQPSPPPPPSVELPSGGLTNAQNEAL